MEMRRTGALDVKLDWNPVLGNMNNRMNRTGTYHPVALDEAVPPLSEDEKKSRGIPDDYLEHHDAEGMRRRGVKGMTRTRRNAVSNHHADQFICPRCSMHINRDHGVVKRILRHMADEGMDKLDIQYIDFYAQLLPKPHFVW